MVMPGPVGLTGRGLEVWRNECVMPELHRRWGRFPWSGSTPPPAADPTSVYSASSYDQLVRAQQRQRQLLPPALVARNKGSLPPGKRRQVIGANSICSKRSELKAAADKDKETH